MPPSTPSIDPSGTCMQHLQQILRGLKSGMASECFPGSRDRLVASTHLGKHGGACIGRVGIGSRKVASGRQRRQGIGRPAGLRLEQAEIYHARAQRGSRRTASRNIVSARARSPVSLQPSAAVKASDASAGSSLAACSSISAASRDRPSGTEHQTQSLPQARRERIPGERWSQHVDRFGRAMAVVQILCPTEHPGRLIERVAQVGIEFAALR